MKALSHKCILAFALALALAATATGATPLLRDYRHTSWTPNEGAPGQISALAQTPDGWLWLGTADGLYRFDGIAFEPVALPARGMLARGQIYTLHAADNGDLWIAHVLGGVSVLRPDGRFDDIAEPAGAPLGPVTAMATDSDGSLWVISLAGVAHLVDGAWRRVVTSTAWKAEDVRSLLRDQDGVMWATFDHQVWRLDRAGNRFIAAGPPGTEGSLMQAPDGSVWASAGAVRVRIAAGSGRPRAARANQADARYGGQFDRSGNLWAIRCPVGACVLPGASARGPVLTIAAGVERMTAPPQITGPNAEQVLEDREGNVWIATGSGLDRYQPNRIAQSGLAGSGTPFSLAADADGAVWAADATSGTLFRLAANRAPEAQSGYARVIGTARDGALLIAGKRAIERRLHGVVTRIALPPASDGKVQDLTVIGMLDDGRVLWIAAYETGLMGLVDGVWRPRAYFNLPPKIVISTAGAPGQLWLADGDGGLSLYDQGKLTRYDAVAAGLASAVFAGPDVMVAGERGLAVLQHGAMRLLRTAQPDVLHNISGMAITPDGDRWFNGAAGMIHVTAADWTRALAQPQALLHVTLLDARDGYLGQATTANRLPTIVQAAGGQLWFAATGGVGRLETATMPRNLAAPAVQVAHVRTSRALYAAGPAQIALPPAAQDFSIAFTAPALRRPENLRFAWRLDGVDAGWVDGGNRRVASYTNVAPGAYRFHVRATNEDGVAGEHEAVQALTIAPTAAQSAWFKALCVLALALAGVALYRYRIRVLTARLSERLQVRASERERIARTLHDTYLQSVHALLLRVGATAQALPPDNATRVRLEHVLADATLAVVEGRNQVAQLRADVTAAPGAPLEQMLERASVPLRQCYPEVAYTLQVTGTPRALPPAVLDEAGQIGAEALRNAFIHAGARAILVTIDYGAQVVLAVRDDGKGLDDDVRAAGYRSGHWGLLGMRERARAIGAVLAIDSAAGAGTTVTLTLAARPAGVLARWRARVRAA